MILNHEETDIIHKTQHKQQTIVGQVLIINDTKLARNRCNHQLKQGYNH